jgi:hypothetical protein
MNVTVYKKRHFDIIAAPGYMFAGFIRPVIIDRNPAEVNGFSLTSEMRLTEIGDASKGYRSGGFGRVRMLPGSWLEFAGRFGENLLLFDVFKDGSKMTPAPDYEQMFLAFYVIGPADLMFLTRTQASRGVRAVFK